MIIVHIYTQLVHFSDCVINIYIIQVHKGKYHISGLKLHSYARKNSRNRKIDHGYEGASPHNEEHNSIIKNTQVHYFDIINQTVMCLNVFPPKIGISDTLSPRSVMTGTA